MLTSATDSPWTAPARTNGELIHAALVPLMRRRWLALQILVAVFAAVLIWSLAQEPVYRSTALVILDPKAPNILGKKTAKVFDTAGGAHRSTIEYLATEAAEACGNHVLEATIDTQDLLADRDFWPAPRNPTEAAERNLVAAKERLRRMVRCSVRRGGASVIEISADHRSRRLAYSVATAMADSYLNYHLDRSVAAARNAEKWLGDQLDSWAESMNKSEAQLQVFREKHDLLSVSLRQTGNLYAEQLVLLNGRLSAAKMKRLKIGSDLEQLKKLLDDGAEALPFVPELQCSLVQSLRADLLQEREEYTALAELYDAEHPKMRTKAAALRAAERALRRELEGNIAGLAQAHQQALNTEKQLADLLSQTKQAAIGLGQHEAEYRRLEREARNAAEMYKLLLHRRTEVELMSKLRFNSARLLRAAGVPERPVRPNLPIRIAFGLMLALALSGLVITLVEIADNKLHSPADIDSEQASPLLGVFPALSASEVRQAETNGANWVPPADAEEFVRAIRTKILLSEADRAVRKLLVTSAAAGEGKTTIAVQLARILSQCDRSVVLVDLDLRRPRLHQLFGVPTTELGITSAIADSLPSNDIVRSTDMPHLSFVSAGPLAANPAEYCHSKQLRRLVEELERAFDYVIIDSSPIVSVSDASVLATQADATVVVARIGVTRKPALREAHKRLAQVGANVLGCIVNGVARTGVYAG